MLTPEERIVVASCGRHGTAAWLLARRFQARRHCIEGPVPSSDRMSNNGRQPGLKQNEDGLADAATRIAYVRRQGSGQSSWSVDSPP